METVAAYQMGPGDFVDIPRGAIVAATQDGDGSVRTGTSQHQSELVGSELHRIHRAVVTLELMPLLPHAIDFPPQNHSTIV